MRLVIALGGNALLKRGEPLSADNQARNMAVSAAGLAQVCSGNEVALVHGNGPQVGLLALEASLYTAVPPYPLDVLGAESQGMMGYVIAQAMRVVLPDREIAALVTQTVVDPKDSAFLQPTKPIGPVYTEAEVATLKASSDWRFAPDGAHLRRVVPSPAPVQIVEASVIAHLVSAGILTICCGGGGIPVVQTDATVSGIEAVIDKDLAATLLAIELRADCLMILTDVDGIYSDWGLTGQKLIRSVSVDVLGEMSFPAGSMGPKAQAACQFVCQTGKPAFIGNLSAAKAVMSGEAGTRVIL